MGLSNIFEITGSALNAQSIHINVIAGNMANSQTTSGSEAGAYRARRPVFASVMASSMGSLALGRPMTANTSTGSNVTGVRIDSFADSNTPIEQQLMPENPFADEDGYIYLSNVNMVEEMAYMMEASRSYQANIEVLNTSKELMLRTLSMGAG